MGKRAKIGLALGGGGARGLAHVGVLKVLEREGIVFDLIVGTSMGAIIGAAYAIEPDAASLEKRVLDFFQSKGKENRRIKLLEKLNRRNAEEPDLFHRLMRIAEKELALSLILIRRSLLSERNLRRILKAILPEVDLRDTKIPFSAVAVDLDSGRKVILDRGPLIRAVMASCAVPGFMSPVPWNGMTLIDGGVIEVLPCHTAREGGAEFVIGVDTGLCICRAPIIGDGFDEIQRVMEIMSFYLNNQHKKSADLLIEPEVKGIHWTDFLKYRELIREGEKAAESKIGEIQKILNQRFKRGLLQRPESWALNPSNIGTRKNFDTRKGYSANQAMLENP
ncbi:MAG: patatin-like phospholipase family protein [Thermodesulfobacteriota bacterium]